MEQLLIGLFPFGSNKAKLVSNVLALEWRNPYLSSRTPDTVFGNMQLEKLLVGPAETFG